MKTASGMHLHRGRRLNLGLHFRAARIMAKRCDRALAMAVEVSRARVRFLSPDRGRAVLNGVLFVVTPCPFRARI
jgi:hypothetical protein